MPFPFSRRSKTEYAAVEADDYEGLETDGVDATTSSPLHQTSAARTGQMNSRHGRLSGNWTEIGTTKAPLPEAEEPASDDPLVRHMSRDAVGMDRPAPGPETMKGPSLDNVLRFEGSASRTSMGMDIEAELKKMREEQKLSDSRRSSLQQSRPQSLRNSGQFQLGEIASPSTYLMGSGNPFNDSPLMGKKEPTTRGLPEEPHSPVDGRPLSAFSNRQSAPSTPLALQTTFKEAHGFEAGEEMTRGPSQAYSESVYSPEKGGMKMEKTPSKTYSQSVYSTDRQANTLIAPPPEPSYEDDESVYTPLVEPPQEQRGMHADTEQQNPDGSYGLSKRRGSVGSMDTFQQAETLFRDFDGAHIEHHDGHEDEEASALMGDTEDFSSRRASRMSKPASRRLSNMTITQEGITTEEKDSHATVEFAPEVGAEIPVEGEDATKRHSTLGAAGLDAKRKSTMTIGPVRPQTPPEGHVYYPAPIPAVLNLPPKLSRGRTAADLRRKKGEIIMATNQRKSKLQPGMYDASSMRGDPTTELDPHLKASLYFDRAPVKHVLKPIEGSASRTLDHILDISAGAPLDAFTDHPYAGKLGPEVYGPELTEKERKAAAAAAAAKRKSKRPLTTAYHGQTEEGAPASPEGDGNEESLDGGHGAHDGEGVAPEDANHFQNGVPEYIPIDAAKPTTLLAELQIRKLEQKQRSRTAATAFPNGMHSTLLQLDAVAQHQAKSRRDKHIHLAWEDPDALVQDEDDEVPLGLLLPGAKRPEGSLLPPVPQPREMTPSPGSEMHEEEEEEEEDDEPEETMAERKARLAREAEEKKKYTLNIDGLAEVKAKEDGKADSDDDEPLAVRKARLHRRNSSTFASEIMSQLGGLDEEENSKAEQASPGKMKKIPARHRASRSMLSTHLSSNGGKKTPEAEETLGQRRRRLQAEQAAREDAKALQKEVKRRRSSIDMLNGLTGDNHVDEGASQMEQGGMQTPQMGGFSAFNPMQSTASLVMGPNGVLQFTTAPEQAQQQAQQQQQQQQQLLHQWQQPQPQFPYQHQPQPQAHSQVFMHPAYAANPGLAQQQHQQMAANPGRPGHLSAYQQQQMMSGMSGMGAMSAVGAMSGRMSQLPPSMNSGRRDMVDRWRQGVVG